MDSGAPECPPRPEKNLLQKRAQNFNGLRKQALLLDAIPPLPDSSPTPTAPTFPVGFQSNILYNGSDNGTTTLRPSTLASRPKLSLISDPSLIDFDSNNNDDNRPHANGSGGEHDQDEKIANIKRLMSNVSSYSNVGSPLDIPLTAGASSRPSFLPNNASNGVNFLSNPLYTNLTGAHLSTVTPQISTPLSEQSTYSNVLYHTYNQPNSPIHPRSIYPGESLDAFLHQQKRMQSELMTNEIMEKISRNSQFQHQHNSEQSILSPTNLLSPNNVSVHTASDILSLFDPLAQNENPHSRFTHSPIPMSPSTEVPSTSSPVSSNDVADGYLPVSGEIMQLVIDPRSSVIPVDLREFVDHLRALYLSIRTKTSGFANQGLIWSAQIEIPLQKFGYAGSSDQYMISPGKKLQPDSDTDFILEVRYNSLIHARLTGEPLPRVVADSPNDCCWYSIKIPATFESKVESIVLYIIYNVGNDQLKVNSNNFLIKIYGRNEYLFPLSVLSSYVYVQKCKRLNQNVVLELVDSTLPEFWRPFAERESDCKLLKDDFSINRLLPDEADVKFISVNEQILNKLLEDLNFVFAQFLSLTDIVGFVRENGFFNQISACLKEISSRLSNLQTSKLYFAVEELVALYDKHILGQDTKTGDSCDNDILRDHFHITFCSIADALSEIIQLYSRSFPVDFEIKTQPTLPKREESIVRNIQHLKVKLDFVTQLSAHIRSKYQVFVLRTYVSYGFKVLDYKCTLKKTCCGTDWVHFNQDVKFDNVVISELPREARLNFELIGMLHSSVSRNDFEVIASTFFYLFDCNKRLFQGAQLLTFALHKSPFAFSVTPEHIGSAKPKISDENYVISLPVEPNAMMLVFNLPTSNIRYFFPEVTTEKGSKTSKTKLSLDSVVPLPPKSSSAIPDSLYGFYGYSTSNLGEQNRQKIIDIVQKNPLEPLSTDECKLIWEHRNQLSNIPGALLKILKSPSSWSSQNLRGIYSLLDEYDSFQASPMSLGSVYPGKHSLKVNSKKPFTNSIEALQLLSADYPDANIRRTAVWWLKTVSTDELCDYLPQLIQALRYEPHIDCPLIWLLFECSLNSSRFCHYFYWLLKSNHQDEIFGARAQFYSSSLTLLCGGQMAEMFHLQELLCTRLADISSDIKTANNANRNTLLRQRLEEVHQFLENNPIAIPLSPSVQVNGLLIDKCTFFNSNSLPLKIVFYSAPPYATSHKLTERIVQPTRPNLIRDIYEQRKMQSLSKVIFKCGDDLRQDMLVMQIISIINRIWLRAGLDLRLVTFGVMNSHERTGMIELVSQARTLREIQVEYGVTGNFKHHTIASWLKRFNPNEFEYTMAVENFLHSCAGYVVITYLLGICDRHNDNIMITTSGHLFHIDFGKFLGDSQTISGIKRDRAPFVFTADMLYVINAGSKPTKSYQFFVELCCNCFSIVRQHGNFFLSLLSMMIPSGIFGLTPETIQFFHKALMPDLTDSHAKSEFNLLIEKSRDSFATQINFLMHNLAQMRFTGTSSTAPDPNANYYDPGRLVQSSNAEKEDFASMDFERDQRWKFSFTEIRSDRETDGKILRLDVIGYKKQGRKSDKVYYNKINVIRERNESTFIYRTHKEFIELNERLIRNFELARFPRLSGSPILSRSNRAEIAKVRCEQVHAFIEELQNPVLYGDEIRHCDIVYTFFKQIARDRSILETEPSNIQPQLEKDKKIKLTIDYRESEGKLAVLVGHARNLESESDPTPSTYAKLYLVPDSNKNTKRKTRVISQNPNPTYMDWIVYSGITLEDLQNRALEVSIWASEMAGNRRLGSTNIFMNELKLDKPTEKWFSIR